MPIWIFTFGLDHPLKNKVQPVTGSFEQARVKMTSLYGDKWACQYHICELEGLNVRRGRLLLPPYEPLPEVSADVDMRELRQDHG